jgi:microcystin-dependent protein
MAFNKPNVNTVWAATGGIIVPANAKVSLGWISEIPDFEFENWAQNRQDSFNAHVNQFGIPVWDSATEYVATKSYAQASDGEIYRALTTHTNANPITPSVNWVRAFDNFDTSYDKAEADGRFLRISNNLSDLSNASTARTNLSVFSITQTDAKYLFKASNLSDLASVSTARTNISVYSQAETDAKYPTKANNLSDLASAATARTNLDVYSKAETYTKSESDSAFIDATGDTMIGKLTLDGNPVNALHATPKQYVDSVSTPAGSVIMMAANSLPAGYLKCNGAAVSRTTYALLFGVVGTIYGVGNGSTTFNLPDLRGEFIRGWDDSRGIDAGRSIGSFQSEEFKAHTHTGSTDTAGSHSHASIRAMFSGNDGGFPGTGSQNLRTGAASQNIAGLNSFSMPAAGDHFHTLSIASSGGSETRPRNIAMLYCIKT